MIDLGEGFTLMPFVQRDGGPIVGYVETHPRPDNGEPCAGSIYIEHAERPDGHPDHPRWRLTEGTPEAPLTLEPSILCRSCGNHGWIRGGKWVKV